jgi:hypothetical protein
LTYHAVTTCNAAGWESTGRRMAESFVANWRGIDLTVYAEDFDVDVPGVRMVRLPAWLDAFKAHHAHRPDARGMASGTYNYRRDCVRFAHKVAAYTDAIGDGTMVWLDADTFTFDQVDADWLDSLWGDESAYLAWLARAGTYPECGFVMFRREHPSHVEVMHRLLSLYTRSTVLALPETHDSYVLQHVVETAGVPVSDLSGPKSRRGHPWLGSRLAEKMDHLKGARKAVGRTPKHERQVRDGVEYWR